MNTRCVPVSLGDRSYNIEIASGLLSSGRAAEEIARLQGVKRACIVTHPVLETQAVALQDQLMRAGVAAILISVPSGERIKKLATVARLYSRFLNAGLDRKGIVVALGGGVLGDLAGFAAATYLRGIRFVQVPTTLLAQVDASVGGKTGVDLPEGKNLVGAFHQPSAVLIDPDTLKTLPARELRAGLAEVIKYGIIYDDAFFLEIGQHAAALAARDEPALISAIARSCEIKAEVVQQDETEQGLRAILNFGHTVGHALEVATRYRRYKHGEAVAIGMVSACLIGEEIGVTPPDVTEEVVRSLRSFRLSAAFPGDVSSDTILRSALRDKKTQAGELHFVLARRLGDVFVTKDVPSEAVHAALSRQAELHN